MSLLELMHMDLLIHVPTALERGMITQIQNQELLGKANPKDQVPKDFFNCTHEPIINADDDVLVIDVIVPAELHLGIGIVCKLFFKANELMENEGYGKDKVNDVQSITI